MKSIELFAGIGGIALAAEWAGIETVAFCEKDSFCQKVLKKHWPDVPIFDDIRTLSRKSLEERGIDIGAIELISGGFPCQPYSVAGKQRGKDDDRDLWTEMFRVIREIKPNWVVGENVANFVNMELERTLSDLESLNYETQTFIIPACGVNATHRRDRVFIVSRASEMVLNTSGERWEKGDDETRNAGKGKTEWESWTADSFNGHIWESEPGVGRVANGISDRVDRLRGLGNAVVPQQIYPIFEAIMKVN